MKSAYVLPFAIITGIVSYFIYVNISALDNTHRTVSHIISYLQPTLLFIMLFASFCKVAPHELRPHRWMLKMLGVQVFSFVLLGLILIYYPNITGKIIIESGMICMICPTATAAVVVTNKLHGNASTVVSYTCIINLSAAIIIPCIISFMDIGSPEHGFTTSFLLILGKVFPLLILPLLLAWFVRYMTPGIHKKILSYPNLAFNLWTIALTLAIAVSVKAFVHSGETLTNLFMIALVSLICCIIQFYIGRQIGSKHGEPVAGAQGLGQKNTIFAIWMAYTFLDPVTALAGGFYSIWHNVINSWQLYRE